jgi:uracil-DNA glycosylase family 4
MAAAGAGAVVQMEPSRRRRYLHELGIPVWIERHREHLSIAAPDKPAFPIAEPRSGSAEQPVWDALRGEVSACTQCTLHQSRTQTVFGVGRHDADLLVIGEAPGADEDRQGEPFVGRAGRLLNAMLSSIGCPRDDVYIANILKCRPPQNRDPKIEESSACTPFLNRQIKLIEPRAILALGRIAAQWLLQTDQAIGKLRGQVLVYGESQIPMVVTYHPAYLLRNPIAKAKSWQDLCLIRELLTSES